MPAVASLANVPDDTKETKTNCHCRVEKLTVLVTSVLMLIGTVHSSIKLFIIWHSECQVIFIM